MESILIIGIIAVAFLLVTLIILVIALRPRQDMSPVMKMSEGMLAANDALSRAVQGQLAVLTERIVSQERAMSEQGAAIDKRLSLFTEISKTLGELTQSNDEIKRSSAELRGGIDRIGEVFSAVKSRGISGEISLENLLSQYLPGHYATQHRLSGGTVDAVIRIGTLLVPIDAKFPYTREFNEMVAMNTDTDEGKRERGKKKKDLIRAVRKMIDDVASKYIAPKEGTSEFAFIYIPAENIFYELLVNDADLELTKYSFDKRVILVSPNTMLSYLYTVHLGLKGLAIEARANDIVRTIASLTKDIAAVRELFTVLGTHLKNAHAKYDDANLMLGKFEGSLERVTQNKGE